MDIVTEVATDDYVPHKLDEIVDAKDDSSGPLTVGIELEFLVPFVDHNVADPTPNVEQLLFRNSESPPDGPIREIDNQLLDVLREVDDLEVHHMDDDEYQPPHGNVPFYDAWRLGHDSTVQYSSKIGWSLRYQWLGCELSSAIMSEDEYDEKITDVISMLRTTRVHLNETTSVHVHVGRGDEAFSLLTLKKFATLYWLTETVIMKLQHPSRQRNKYCYLLTECSNLASIELLLLGAELRDAETEASYQEMSEFVPIAMPGLSVVQRAQIRRIWSFNTIENLALAMQGNRSLVPSDRVCYERGALGFKRFLPAGKSGGNTQTFEWRQMAGCLDVGHILRWVRLTLAFTNFCRLSKVETYQGLLATIINHGGTYTEKELVEDLGLAEEASFFKDKAVVYAGGMEDYFEGQSSGNLFVPPM
ncbi:hypothetical protein F5Y15DRAFT_429020 [Xylariaceae sp. FL0016]|nr:hypothetical protein F5Y15DRAFT_429020 [Xylariaceae sp. FL0016]